MKRRISLASIFLLLFFMLLSISCQKQDESISGTTGGEETASISDKSERKEDESLSDTTRRKETEFIFDIIEGKKEYRVVAVKTANKEITIPSTYNGLPITEIGKSAFAGIAEIEKVDIPDSVKIIGEKAFDDCRNLKSIRLPRDLEIIPAEMTRNSSIKSIVIPNSVKRIEYRAFCTSQIKDLVIPDSVEYIGYEAFYFSNIETVIIGKNIKEIQPYAFRYCDSLKSVTFSNPSNIYMYGVIFDEGFLENPENIPPLFLDEEYACRHWFAKQ